MHVNQPDRIAAPSVERPGFLSGLFAQHPALTSGAVVSALTIGFVITNALWFQPVKHPAPMFNTRVQEKPVNHRTATKSAPVKVQKVAADNESSAEVLREVQAALSVRGYYGGKVDGKYGSKTKSAIIAFQRDHSLNQDGKASVRLLSQVLLSASATPKEVPIPKRQVASAKEKPSAEPVKTAVARGLVAQIQAGLKNYGYDELVVDGKAGRQTKTAIQRFQLDYGMKITGEPTEQVLQKLREIGAYKQG